MYKFKVTRFLKRRIVFPANAILHLNLSAQQKNQSDDENLSVTFFGQR